MTHERRGPIAVLLAVGLAVPLAAAAAPDPDLPPLRASADGRSFVTDGEPFFWLGDAPAAPLTSLDRLVLERYLDGRAAAGTTVVRTALGDGPNAYDDVAGETPAVTPGADPADPAAYDFWDHASYVVDAAAERGIRVALDPGDGGPGYGEFLGGRFGDDVVWVLDGGGSGGDGSDDGGSDDLARGIAVGATGTEDYSGLLMTAGPGRLSADSLISAIAPCGVAPVTAIAELLGGCADGTASIDVRRSAYAAVFDGAAGRTVDAEQAGAGAAQLTHLRALMESRPFLTRATAPELLTAGAEGTRVLRDSGHLMAHAPSGAEFALDTTGLSGDALRGWWFDPRTGTPIDTGTVPRGGSVPFFPPTTGPADAGLDWVLVVDDATRGFPPPGSVPSGS